MAGRGGIQKVTTVLARLLADRLETSAAVVTCGPPKNDAGGDVPLVNLFLYHVKENPYLRNQDEPRRSVPGEYGAPPLALELGFLVTTYGRKAVSVDGAFPAGDSQTELESQQLLADVMRVFHETPILTGRTQRIRPAGGPLLDAELRREWEALRITPRGMDLDESSKLWTAFKADFQRSAAYQVSVIRIESRTLRPPAAPVLVRSFDVVPTLGTGPLLAELRPTAAPAGEPVYLVGERLADPTLEAVVEDDSHAGFPDQFAKLPIVRDAQGLHFVIPDDATRFLPGAKKVYVRSDAGEGKSMLSDGVPFQILPRVDSLVPGQGSFDGSVTVEVRGALLGTIAPDSQPALRPAVLFGGHPIPAGDLDLSGLPHRIKATLRSPADPTDARAPRAGQALPVRVRLNGVESRTWRLESDGSIRVNPAVVFEAT